MGHKKQSNIFGNHLALSILCVSLLAASLGHAETVATVNGVEIERTVFEFYLASRLQKPALQATDAERELVLQEIKDIYALTTQSRATELSRNPQFMAQIELQYRASLAQVVANDWFESNPATEEEIQAAYISQSSLGPAIQYKASHILVETQSSAIDLIAQLDAGANFAELARSSSVGPSAPSGGDLGWFSPSDMVAPFSEAVSGLEDGAYTKSPVQTQFGWHVILREESRKNEPPPLESIRDDLKSNVEQSNFQRYLEQLRTADGISE
ncbi:MAG: peptidylprolyl isomerase [Gammaproteobacteria bacterium]|nr:peptidylprolyl isomerase [Gammaproteobacteria bacterium]MDH5322772.1 peptidylprolyl isomerase [Gammaproteobacteria bacterium]